MHERRTGDGKMGMCAPFAGGTFVRILFLLPGFDFSYISNYMMHTPELGLLQYALACAMFEYRVDIGGTAGAPSDHLSYILKLVRQSSH